jgi:hypothetical protein
MALDKIGLAMVAPYIKGAQILCLGYPDITARPEVVEELLGVKPRKFTDNGRAHKVSWPLPETIDTLMLAGASKVVCIDRTRDRGVEEIVDLNYRLTLKDELRSGFGIVINPGTLEHCFDIATATFNAWGALVKGGVMMSAAPLSMGNHGFYNIQPTFFVDFARENGGELLQMIGRARDWAPVEVTAKGRFAPPPECVLYTLLRKNEQTPERIPTQGRFL